MKHRAGALLADVHELAKVYHWREPDVLALTLARRLAYRLLIEADRDAALLGVGG